MQISHDEASFARSVLVVVATALSVIVACSALSFQRIVLRFRQNQKPQYQSVSEPYKDEDGTATQASEAAYSYQLPRISVLLFSIVCLLNSLVLCIIATQQPLESNLRIEQWLHFCAWVCSDTAQVAAVVANSSIDAPTHSSSGIVHRATVHCSVSTISIRFFVQPTSFYC